MGDTARCQVPQWLSSAHLLSDSRAAGTETVSVPSVLLLAARGMMCNCVVVHGHTSIHSFGKLMHVPQSRELAVCLRKPQGVSETLRLLEADGEQHVVLVCFHA